MEAHCFGGREPHATSRPHYRRQDDQLFETARSSEKALQEANSELRSRLAAALETASALEAELRRQERLASLGEALENVAHQWRQPLNCLGLHLQIMRAGGEEDSTDALESCLSLVDHLSDTIDDFLDFGRADTVHAPFSLDGALTMALAVMDIGLRVAGISCSHQCPPGLVVHGHRRQLSQALIILLSNSRDALLEAAVDYPRITVTATAGPGGVELCIRDNGPGFSDTALANLFKQLHTTKAGGNGRGMVLAKRIVEEMGGGIRAGNDAGALVTITLPAHVAF